MEQRISELEQAMIQLALAQAKTEAQVEKTEAQVAKTEAQVKITSKIVSGIGINLGNATEQIFYEALKSKMALGAIKFDSIHENVSVKRKNLHPEASGEFDILMYNGTSVAIIETKHNVQQDDIQDLEIKKVNNFRKLFPKYAKHKVYLGIAGHSFPKSLQELALKKGIAVLAL